MGLVKRGRAVWDSPDSIALLPEKLIRQLTEMEKERLREREVEQGIIRYRGGKVWWNGKDRNPNAQHRPGEVVS